MTIDESSPGSQSDTFIPPYINSALTYGMYLLCILLILLSGLACTIANDDPEADTTLRFEVVLAPRLSAAQVGSLAIEVWIQDLDDSPFTISDRDGDPFDTAMPLVERVVVQNMGANVSIDQDRFAFDLDFGSRLSSGDNLLASVLLFPAANSTVPAFVGRQGPFNLPEALGQTFVLTLGAAELIQFAGPTISESTANAVFTGTLTPSSPRAVVVNAQTQDGTSDEFDTARAGEDYQSTTGAIRFEPGVTEASFNVSVTDDVEAEETEAFHLQLALDVLLASNNHAFIVDGFNGGTFTQVTGIITDEDSAPLPPLLPTGLRFEAVLSAELEISQVRELMMEVWVHDLDDSPFDNLTRDSDQIDTAAQLLDRTMATDVLLSSDIDDRLVFDIDLENSIAAGDNLVFSVLMFPAGDSTEPTLVARQGAFSLPQVLGQTISSTLGAVELLQFGGTTVSESMENAVFTGTLTPDGPRAVVLNLQTQDGTSSEFEVAMAGEDYVARNNEVIRFEPRETEAMFTIELINDIFEEPTESFDVQISLNLQFPTNNRAFIVGGGNGGTFTQVTGVIMDEDSAVLPPPPATGIRLEVLLPLGGDITEVADLLLEVWAHDLDDSPFDITDRDSDQVDTATRLLDRTMVRDLQLSNEITDRILFDLDLANGVTAGNNLVFSVLTFPAADSDLPTLVARQGNFDLPAAFGQTISMALGMAEIVAFENTTVEETAPNAIFPGSITPSSPRAVVLNFVTRDGTSPQFDAARSGEDYAETTGVIRFEAGEVEETIIVPIINDAFAEPTETFDVLFDLDIRSATNNRAYIAGGLNGGTFGELTGTITDEDAPVVAPPPDTGIRFAVDLPPELDVTQAADQRVEIWIHDLDDNPFTNGIRDRDQIDIAQRLQDRTVVRDLVLNGEVADPLTFDIDLANELSIGDNLVLSVLMFPTDTDLLPTFVARQGPFDLDALLGQTTSLILGSAEIVQFSDTTANEGVGNAAFAGTLTPASNRAVDINFRTQNGTTPGVA